VEKMIFDLVAKATLNERFGPRSKSLGPFRDYAELESRGEDPHSVRAQGLVSVRTPNRRNRIALREPIASAEMPPSREFPAVLPD
jgi:hypothetical protein